MMGERVAKAVENGDILTLLDEIQRLRTALAECKTVCIRQGNKHLHTDISLRKTRAALEAVSKLLARGLWRNAEPIIKEALDD
jgi:hypothetical protein